MVEYIYQGASIECNSAVIIARKITSSSFIHLPGVGNCMKYNCKRNSEAKINQELKPKIAIYNKSSHLDLGDAIGGEEIFFYVNMQKKLKPNVISYTGRHKAQTVTTNCFTYAEISLQFPNIKIIKDPLQAPPNKIENK